VVEHGLGQDAAGRVVGAQEQNVQSFDRGGHGVHFSNKMLRWRRGSLQRLGSSSR